MTEGLQPDELIISDDIAKKYSFKAGDVVTIGYFDVEEQDVLPMESYRIGKVSSELDGDSLMSWSSPLNSFSTFERMYVDTDNDIQALKDLESIRSLYPELQVTALSEELEQAQEMFFQRWALFIIVLIVMIVSTMVGVLNALFNNILSKRKEFAVLRAIGVPPKGIIQIILTQIILYILIGVIVGCVIGVILVVLLILIDPTKITFNVPVIALTSMSILLLCSIVFLALGRKLTLKSVPQEMTMDGK